MKTDYQTWSNIVKHRQTSSSTCNFRGEKFEISFYHTYTLIQQQGLTEKRENRLSNILKHRQTSSNASQMIKEKVGKILTMDSGIPNTTIHDESTVTHIDQQNQSFPRRPFLLREGIFAFFSPSFLSRPPLFFPPPTSLSVLD